MLREREREIERERERDVYHIGDLAGPERPGMAGDTWPREALCFT